MTIQSFLKLRQEVWAPHLLVIRCGLPSARWHNFRSGGSVWPREISGEGCSCKLPMASSPGSWESVCLTPKGEIGIQCSFHDSSASFCNELEVISAGGGAIDSQFLQDTVFSIIFGTSISDGLGLLLSCFVFTSLIFSNIYKLLENRCHLYYPVAAKVTITVFFCSFISGVLTLQRIFWITSSKFLTLQLGKLKLRVVVQSISIWPETRTKISQLIIQHSFHCAWVCHSESSVINT